MIFSRLTLALAASAGMVKAATNFTTCCSIDPTTVTTNLAATWCLAQLNTCPELCENGQTTENTCVSSNLTYSCVCASGNTPNVSSYGQTLPSLECEEWASQCITAHPNDAVGQAFCHSFVCGNQNASARAASASSAASSASSTGASATSGSASSATATSSSAAVAALQIAKTYGTGALSLSLLALFGFAL